MSKKNNNNKKILLVDDEPEITSLFRIGLEDAGFAVDTFNDPLLALKTFEQDNNQKKPSYALALLDIRMPKMNGIELFKEIRKINDKIKVCFVTAFDIQKEQLKTIAKVNQKPAAYDNGDIIIRKPISIDNFVERVKAGIPPQNSTPYSTRQIHFLICETCFWCTSLVSQVSDNTTILNWHTCENKIICSYALCHH
jgi:DNA-binding response OmpR family regulator